MPENPASEDVVADSDGAGTPPAAVVREPPRTVKRRTSWRPTEPGLEPRVVGRAAGAARAAPPAEEAAEASDEASVSKPVVPEPVITPAVAAEPTAKPEPEPDPLDEPVAAEEETAPESATEPDAPRTGRIEVPVPSVVRARERAESAARNPIVLRAESLTKSYGQVLAAADISFEVHAGSLTGVVGPNGAGKTTVLSMVSGLNRPSSGRIAVRDIDVWSDGPAAKRLIGSLPDRLRLFDRLTGGQLLYYAGVLQGLDQPTVASRAAELATAFGLESALDRPVSDYSAGMQKKIGLACSMIHAPEVLVLDEPYETIDPVSASNVTEILEKYVAGGGSVVMSSHSLDLIQRICDHVVVIVDGSVVAKGTVDEVRDGVSLEDRFTHLTRQDDTGKGLGWLHGSSDSD